MKRIWPFAACIGLLMACQQQKNVRREVWPRASEPQPAVAEAPAPPPKVLDPVIVELPEKSERVGGQLLPVRKTDWCLIFLLSRVIR